MGFEIWLAHFPAWLVLLLFAIVPSLIVVGLHAIFRRYVRADRLIPHHDVAGFLVGITGVVYAVVLGFLVVTAWVSFDSAQANADLEASDAAELFSFAGVLPDPQRTRLRTAMANYAFEVRDAEWPMLVYDRQDLRARSFYSTALPDIASVATGNRAAVEQAALAALHELSVHRRQRLISAAAGLPEALYVALILGAVIVMVFVFLFGVDNLALQFTMTFLTAAMIGLLLGTIVLLDRPYSGPLRVSPHSWTLVIENNDLAKYQTIEPRKEHP